MGKDLSVLYYPNLLKKRFSKGIVNRIQDSIVQFHFNTAFIEVSDETRSKVRSFLHSAQNTSSALLILGGDSLFPFQRVRSPVDDGDGEICTDNFWSSSLKDFMIPSLAVSRIPDSEGEREQDFIEKIERILSASTVIQNEKFSVSAEIWKKASEEVFSSLTGTGEMLISPPLSFSRDAYEFIDFSGSLYFNLHGGKDLSDWYGQRKSYLSDGEEYPVAASPSMMKNDASGSFLYSEACFGGYLNGKTSKRSIILTAIENGMPFAFASTATAYGAFSSPISEADLLGKYFFEELIRGRNSSDASLNAKRRFARESIKKSNFLDEDDKKTLLEFTLYGNPFTEVKYE